MKRFNELTNDELTELSQDEIQNLIDVEIAFAGILPVMEPQLPEYREFDLQKTEIVFKVGSMMFKNAEDAQKVLEMSVLKMKYDYSGIGYSYQWTEPDTDLSLQQEKYYTGENIYKVRDMLITNEKLKKEFTKKKDEYDKFVKETSSIRSEVFAKVDEAWSFKNELTYAKSMFEKYMKLSDNDKVIAQRFFRDAFKNKPEIIEAMFPVDFYPKIID